MLSRKQLIPLRKEFGKIRQDGKLYSSDSFGLVISYGKNVITQCAFIVSKKVSRLSVVRHRVKRQLSDAITPHLTRLPQNLQLVFLAKIKSVGKTTEELKNEIEITLKRAHLTS